MKIDYQGPFPRSKSQNVFNVMKFGIFAVFKRSFPVKTAAEKIQGGRTPDRPS